MTDQRRDSTLQLADFHLVPRRRIWHRQGPLTSCGAPGREPYAKHQEDLCPKQGCTCHVHQQRARLREPCSISNGNPRDSATPGLETSPTPSPTAATPQAEEKTPSQPASTPVDSTAQPPPLPAESTTPSEPSATPGANLVPPAPAPAQFQAPLRSLFRHKPCRLLTSNFKTHCEFGGCIQSNCYITR